MKFLCMAYYDVEKFAAIAPDELERIVIECRKHDEALRATGALVAGGSLAPPEEAFLIRPRRGEPSITDGPFAETHEQVGGMMIIEAKDRDEAKRIASMHPAATLNEHLGWFLEVRGIEKFTLDELKCRLDTGVGAR